MIRCKRVEVDRLVDKWEVIDEITKYIVHRLKLASPQIGKTQKQLTILDPFSMV